MTVFHKISVFIIDDEQLVLEDVADELTASGFFDVTGRFTNLPAALQAVEKVGAPDFILCDIHMEGMDGLQVTTLFKDVCDFIVLMTGYPELSEKAFGAYPQGCVFKPVDIKDLMPLVKRFLTHHRNRQTEIVGGNLMAKGSKEGGIRPIPVDDITYIEALADYAKIVTASNGTRVVLATMKGLAAKLVLTGKFMRISNKHIIAYSKIRAIEDKSVYVEGSDRALKVTTMGERAFETFLKNVWAGEYKKELKDNQQRKKGGRDEASTE
ncbi:LytR/AlgR family response regulator transcription factor [Parapedobacter deserti]|uniref:LytR/AlgR family response regulator transcription factor n=1 Tax=Parapedobacter deserti TaxID=1912957 RepID=A0ABV7JSL3_9SPHI